MGALDQAAVAKVSGPAWNALRNTFMEVSDLLLSASPISTSELTTIYVKYSVPIAGEQRVYAVAWLQTLMADAVALGVAAQGKNVQPNE